MLEANERNVYLEDLPMADALARLEAALRRVGRWEPLPAETVPLRQAVGRVTAAPVWAGRSSPHYHAAAMDGYAVNAADTREATETRPIILTEAQAHPVNTGDPLPDDANAVVMIENVDQTGDGIMIRAAVPPWQHVRMMGEDMVATELVLPANHRLRPADLGAAAGCGHASLPVRRRPHVAIIPTGSELVPADQDPAPGQIIEYNSLVLAAQAEEAGAQVTISAIVPDDPAQLRQMLDATLADSPDLVLVLSGSSAGSRDFTAAMLREAGELLVHGVAVRPGHPVIMGIVAETPVIGVPGYPVSAALTGEIFVAPLLARWSGQPDPLTNRPTVEAVSARKIASPVGDDDFVRVSLAQVGDRLLAAPLSRGAGVITSLVRADGLAHIPRFNEGVDMGEPLQVMLYRPLDALARTLMASGSHDPMLDLLAGHLATAYPGFRLASANVGSMGGLVALKRREAHLAGSHLLDPESGQYNIPYIQRQLRGEPVAVVTFAHREQGLIVAPGNPLAITGLDDLPRVRYVNRQRGAGTRLLLDYELTERGIAPADVAGYEREEYTHLAVAAAVATSVADCGLGVRSAAIALNLDFISVGWERYDLVIPLAHLANPGMMHLLDVLRGAEFQAALRQHPGYDTTETGVEQARIG